MCTIFFFILTLLGDNLWKLMIKYNWELFTYLPFYEKRTASLHAIGDKLPLLSSRDILKELIKENKGILRLYKNINIVFEGFSYSLKDVCVPKSDCDFTVTDHPLFVDVIINTPTLPTSLPGLFSEVQPSNRNESVIQAEPNVLNKPLGDSGHVENVIGIWNAKI